jgi:hypothetical protein
MFYYFDDGAKFTSKIEAIKYGYTTIQRPKFYYHDHVYKNVDWTIEPVHSLEYYYKDQAQRIRDTYDYVILAYSGGYDSTNILETFHFNNIKLDKILIVGAFSQDTRAGADDNHNGELYHNAFPYINELGLAPITQILDYTTLFGNVNNFSISSYNENWVDEIGAWFSPHNWLWRDIGKYIVPTKWKNKRIALVFGKDKPSLFSKVDSTKPNGFHFRDTPCMSYADTGQYEDITRVNFYWDHNNTNVLLKQLHVLNRFYSVSNTSSYNSEQSIQTLGGLDINKIVYDLRKPLIYKSPKSKNNLLSLRDNYLQQKQNSDVFSLYQLGIGRIDREIGVSSMTPILSRFYSIVQEDGQL